MGTTTPQYTYADQLDQPLELGATVEVATRPARNPSRTMRDSAGTWGFGPDEWRPARISYVGTTGAGPTARFDGRYGVQFKDGDATWGFSPHEVRIPAEQPTTGLLTAQEIADTHKRLQGRSWPGAVDREVADARSALMALAIALAQHEARDPFAGDLLAGMRGPDGVLGSDIEPEQYLAQQDAAAERADWDDDEGCPGHPCIDAADMFPHSGIGDTFQCDGSCQA